MHLECMTWRGQSLLVRVAAVLAVLIVPAAAMSHKHLHLPTVDYGIKVLDCNHKWVQLALNPSLVTLFYFNCAHGSICTIDSACRQTMPLVNGSHTHVTPHSASASASAAASPGSNAYLLW